MWSDSTTALIVVGLLLVVVSVKQFSFTVMELLLGLTRPGATIVLLLAVLGLLYKKYTYTGLALSVLTILLLKDLWVKYPRSDARRLRNEVILDEQRFDPKYSVDLQWGNKTAKHDKPLLQFQTGSPKLLVFPPSDKTLNEMCG